jgi:hypothetical protein
VNSTIDTVLNQLDGDDILEKLKLPNSKWSIESIYEYVLLTTPLPEVPIGASVILPDFIKNSKSLFHSKMSQITFAFGIALLVISIQKSD